MGFPIWEFWEKWKLGVTPLANHGKYYKGEGGGSPQFRPWWVLGIHVCMWFIHAPKVLQLCITNLLFGLCRSIWIIDMLIICPNPHPRTLACPYTLKVLQIKECTPTPYYFVVFTLGLAFESIKKFGGASITMALNGKT